MMRGALVSDAFVRLEPRIDEIEIPELALVLANHHKFIEALHEFGKSPRFQEQGLDNSIIHQMEMIQITAERCLRWLSPVVGSRSLPEDQQC
jgi:hypothetical protein